MRKQQWTKNGKAQKVTSVAIEQCEAQKKDKVHFATSMDICHLKNAELQIKPASQMTAAKVMDVKSRLPGCAGKQLKRFLLTLNSKWMTLQSCSQFQITCVQNIWIRLPRHMWPKSWSDIEDLVVPLERKLDGHPLARLLCERQFEEILFGVGWESTQLGMSFWSPFLVGTRG